MEDFLPTHNSNLDSDVSPSVTPAVLSSPVPPVQVIAVVPLVLTIGIFGNILVCLAVTQFRNLQTVANFYVVSLAIADLLVCIFIMPLALYLEVTGGRWFLRQPLCKIWGSLDILLSTSSILHLCAISIDRYSAITAPLQYVARRTAKMACRRIAITWMLSTLVSGPAFFLFRAEHDKCFILDTTNIYALCSSLISFYIPCVVILIVYFQIYNAAKRRARRIIKPAPVLTVSRNAAVRQSQDILQSCREIDGQDEAQGSNPLSSSTAADVPDGVPITNPVPARGIQIQDIAPVAVMLSTRARAQSRISLAHERKAARTIGVVVGAFIVCWLPFFVLHSIVTPMCSAGGEGMSCEAVPTLYNVFTWVGWCNSSLNPIIYTVFNREFRQAFKKLLSCRKA